MKMSTNKVNRKKLTMLHWDIPLTLTTFPNWYRKAHNNSNSLCEYVKYHFFFSLKLLRLQTYASFIINFSSLTQNTSYIRMTFHFKKCSKSWESGLIVKKMCWYLIKMLNRQNDDCNLLKTWHCLRNTKKKQEDHFFVSKLLFVSIQVL